MGYRVYYDELYDLLEKVNALENKWSTSLTKIAENTKSLYEAEGFRGKGADNIKNYINEIHIATIQPNLLAAITKCVGALAAYVNGYGCLEYGNTADKPDGFCYNTFEEEELRHLGTVDSRFISFMQRAAYYGDDAWRYVYRIRDLVSYLPSPLGVSGELEELLGAAKNKATAMHDKILEYESAHNGDLDDVLEILEQLRGIISGQLAAGRKSVASYESGDVLSTCNYDKLIVAQKKAVEDIGNLQEEAAAAMKDVQRVNEYHDWEAREEDAKWLKVCVGVVATVVTGVAVVATGGLAAVAICATVGAASAAVNSIADLYVEKGQGTDMWSNICSKEFYDSFTTEDWIGFGKDIVVGGVSGALTGAFGGGASGITASFGKRIGTNVLQSTAKNLISGTCDAIESVAVGKINGKSSDEIMVEVVEITKKTGRNVVVSGISDVISTGLGSGFGMLNNKIGLEDGVIKNYVFEPIEDMTSGIGERTFEYLAENHLNEAWNITGGTKDWKEEIFGTDKIVGDLSQSYAKQASKDFAEDAFSAETQRNAKVKGAAFRQDVFNGDEVDVVTFGGTSTGVLSEDYNNIEYKIKKNPKGLKDELGVRSINDQVEHKSVKVDDLLNQKIKNNGKGTKIKLK